MADLARELALELERWEAAGLRRTLAAPREGSVDLVSNDTLGLARHPAVIAAARAALERAGAGGRASRLLGGGSSDHVAAERACADWLGCEAALLFPSGYQANLGVIGALVRRGDALFSDERNHASLVDGARLSRARVHVHRHLDLAELEAGLARAADARRRLVVTEGVFSMDGDAPDLARLAELCARHDAWLLVDEAHSVGLLGPQGSGAWNAAGVEQEGVLAARIVTGGKALGVAGAFVCGSALLCEHLVQRARGFVFTTAPTPATAAALAAAIGLARGMDAERAHVRELAGELARRLRLPAPAAAILQVGVGSAERAVELAATLDRRGLDVRAVRPPTVPPGRSGLRVVLHAFNSAAEVDELARALDGVETVREEERGSRALERALFVVGTDTGVGKTVVSALLLRAAKRLGAAAYWKPVQTGTDSDTGAVGALTEAAPHELLRPAWSLPLAASPHEAARAAGKAIEPRHLMDGLGGLLRLLPDARIVVELAGGLLVPYRVEPTVETQADWLEHTAPPLVLVARSGLGTLNHTLLTLEALRARHLEPRALFLVGEPHDSNRETLRTLGRPARVYELPFLADLTPIALDDWLDRNDVLEVLRP